jgi:hypothetical protein
VWPAVVEFLHELDRLPKLVAGGYKDKFAIPRSRENAKHLPSPLIENMPGSLCVCDAEHFSFAREFGGNRKRLTLMRTGLLESAKSFRCTVSSRKRI